MDEDFELIGRIEQIETIAVGPGIREIRRLRKAFGRGRWRKLKGKATIKLEDGTIHLVELHWYEAHGLGRRKLKIKEYLDNIMADRNNPHRYALCINNGGYPESLEVRKVYIVLADERAAANDYIRVIDETDEDYLYPAKYFVMIDVPERAAEAMLGSEAYQNPNTR